MEQFKPKKRLNLTEWMAAMRKVVTKPEVGRYYVCDDNIYYRYEVPKGESNAGHRRWHRLTALEIVQLYREQALGFMSPQEWLNSINKPTHKGCDE